MSTGHEQLICVASGTRFGEGSWCLVREQPKHRMWSELGKQRCPFTLRSAWNLLAEPKAHTREPRLHTTITRAVAREAFKYEQLGAKVVEHDLYHRFGTPGETFSPDIPRCG